MIIIMQLRGRHAEHALGLQVGLGPDAAAPHRAHAEEVPLPAVPPRRARPARGLGATARPHPQ